MVDIDLEKFFDRINHDMLMARVARRVKDKKNLDERDDPLGLQIADECCYYSFFLVLKQRKELVWLVSRLRPIN